MERLIMASLLVLALFMQSMQVHAQGYRRPMSAQCFAEAAARHGVLQMELLMILYVERGTLGQTTGNDNKTYDIGMFQINSIHLPKLREFGYSEAQLLNDGCLNVEFAAWHLSQVAPAERLAQARTEEEYFSILANYHSVTPKYNQIYAQRLKSAFNRIQGGRGSM